MDIEEKVALVFIGFVIGFVIGVRLGEYFEMNWWIKRLKK